MTSTGCVTFYGPLRRAFIESKEDFNDDLYYLKNNVPFVVEVLQTPKTYDRYLVISRGLRDFSQRSLQGRTLSVIAPGGEVSFKCLGEEGRCRQELSFLGLFTKEETISLIETSSEYPSISILGKSTLLRIYPQEEKIERSEISNLLEEAIKSCQIIPIERYEDFSSSSRCSDESYENNSSQHSSPYSIASDGFLSPPDPKLWDTLSREQGV